MLLSSFGLPVLSSGRVELGSQSVMWRPWRVRRRLTSTAAPAAAGGGVGQDDGPRHHHAAGAGEEVESDGKRHGNRHQRQDKLSRRKSSFLGIRKRDTVREAGRHLHTSTSESQTERERQRARSHGGKPQQCPRQLVRTRYSTHTYADVDLLLRRIGCVSSCVFLPRNTQMQKILEKGQR